jgi:hypothetical protein
MKILSAGTEFSICSQTDRHDEANGCFGNYADSRNKGNSAKRFSNMYALPTVRVTVTLSAVNSLVKCA